MQDLKYVTGANGFIGTHLTPKLGDFTAIPHDQIEIFNLQPFSQFYFLSTYGNMITHTDEEKILQANINDLIYIINKIDTKKPFKSFVFLSSSSVRLKRQTMYSRCKRAAEEILLSFMEKHDLPVCIIRPFSVTGVGEQKEHLIPTLIRSCYTGELVNFVPRPIHDFIDVEDVVDGILNLSKHSARGIYELGTGVGHSNQEVLEMVEKITGRKANINIVDYMRPYDNQEWVSGNFRARGYGWFSKKSLEQSITEQVEKYKDDNAK